jgi:site-specific recombinase XerD
MTKTHEFEIQYFEGQGELVEKVNQFLDYLRENGKKEKTLYTYGKDMELLIQHFGNGKKIDKITKPLMGGFLKSNLVNKTTSGRDKSAITIKKTKRVVSQFFDFLTLQNVMTDSPMPKAS